MYILTSLILFVLLFNILCNMLSNFINPYKDTKLVNFFFLIGIFLSFFFSLSCIFLVLFLKKLFFFELVIGVWFSSGNLLVEWNFLFDILTCVMLFVISIVSSMVHLYSIDYMFGDKQQGRFLALLSFFTLCMFFLISAGNFVVLLLGWEGVGICSFLLINFWSTRLQANKAALKAVLINKIGDCFFIMGICFVYFYYNTVNIHIFLSELLVTKNLSIVLFNNVTFNLLEIIAFCFLIAVFSKSAQIFLHVWLPDAMEGPTPVSALIHAATMVTAGIILVLRLHLLFILTPKMSLLLLLFGSITCLLPSIIALMQFDLKKIIAYSTCSQLGYMLAIAGLHYFSASLYHLAMHAFFKALLFLSAGSIIHALNNEQDIRRMGKLKHLLPISYISVLVGSFALIGYPFLSGFYSKDFLLELTFVDGIFNWKGLYLYYWLVFSVILTSFYSIKLIYLIFFSKSFNFNLRFINKIKESSFFLLIPLFILSFFSIFAGFYFFNFFSFFDKKEFFLFEHVNIYNFIIKNLPFFWMLFGLLLYFYFNDSLLIFLNKNQRFFSLLAGQKFRFDIIYNKIAYWFLLNSYLYLFRYTEKGFFSYAIVYDFIYILEYFNFYLKYFIFYNNFYNYFSFIIIWNCLWMVTLGVIFDS